MAKVSELYIGDNFCRRESDGKQMCFTHTFDVTEDLDRDRPNLEPLFLTFCELDPGDWTVTLGFGESSRGAMRYLSELETGISRNERVAVFDPHTVWQLSRYGLTPDMFTALVFRLFEEIKPKNTTSQATTERHP